MSTNIEFVWVGRFPLPCHGLEFMTRNIMILDAGDLGWVCWWGEWVKLEWGGPLMGSWVTSPMYKAY